MDLQTLVEISKHFGSDPDFVLAGGGNTSFKTGQHLYIKASGIPLANIDESGFVRMDRQKLRLIWEKEYPADWQKREAQILEDLLAAREQGEEKKRPSVETLLHDLLPQSYVVHTHPALVNGLACAKNGQSAASALFGQKVLWIPSVRPGYTLACTVRNAVDDYVNKIGNYPEIILLQNHGLVVASDTAQGIDKLTESLISGLKSEITRQADFSAVKADRERASRIAPALRMLLKEQDEGSICIFRNNRELARLIAGRKAFDPLSSAYTPDHIIYSGPEPLFVAMRRDLEEQYKAIQAGLRAFRSRNGLNPKIIAIEGLGIFAWGISRKEADTALSVFLDGTRIAVYTESFGGPQFMSGELIKFIGEWEAEAFRRKMAADKAGQGRFPEKIALVTGGARGFGEGLAEGLLKEGCNVVIADLNSEGARATAARFCRTYGEGKAAAVISDVSDENSVRRMITRTVLEFGGLDLLISNAGVLKAGDLSMMDPSSFEFVTGVNYTGYFLCTKFACEAMKLQHRFKPDHRMDIVQINSKSGLAGSNKNFAYSGSKFGGIGLTQSFALELVEHNIKVNSICPGNFFDGPLWSDPKEGLFIQYLEAGKIPGARTMAEIRCFYEDRVPMKRGCRVEDVLLALIYVIEQKYETGQAIPVTGGQIMLN